MLIRLTKLSAKITAKGIHIPSTETADPITCGNFNAPRKRRGYVFNHHLLHKKR
jgi:hypothetical protein